MNVVSLDQLNTGEVLGQDVRDINGRLLLTKGKTVDVDLIRLLKIWGVPEVYIVDQKKAAVALKKNDEQKRQRVEFALRRMFQHIDTDHPAIAAVLKTAIEFRCQHDLVPEYGPSRPLPPDFRLDLYSAIQAQIQFSKLELPESPEIMMQFNKLAADPCASGNDIADVVSTSSSLAALVLKVVNSAAFGFRSRIDTISHAVSLLGTREIGTLAMGISIMRLFHNIPKNLIDMNIFLKHSLACGLLCRILAAQANMLPAEQMFVAGLLHDIGRLVWYRYFPEQAKLSLEIAARTGLPLYDIEKECLAVSHEQIAAQLFRKWNLPESLTGCVLYHHRPSRCPETLGPGSVQMADLAINALGLGHSGEHIIPHFDANTWNRLEISPSALITAIGQTVQQVELMGALFFAEMQDD